MSGKLVYPFKHHTKMQETFFKDMCTWESGKSKVEDFYMWYRRGLLNFTDYTCLLFNHLYEHVMPSAVLRLKKLRRADETTLYFLPCYNFRLLLDFVVNAKKTGWYEWNLSFTAWEKIIMYFRMIAMESYEDCYNKELSNKKFYEIWDIWRCDYLPIFDYALSGSQAELYRAAEGVLVSRLMEKLSAKDNEKTRSFFNRYVTTFFSRDFPEVCRKMHPYYAEVDEIARDIFFITGDSFFAEDRS